MRQAFDAAFQSAHALAACAISHDFSDVRGDARDFRRRDAAAARALEPRGKLVEIALRALADIHRHPHHGADLRLAPPGWRRLAPALA